MKLTQSFSKFLENVVNLNPTRMGIADGSIATMKGIIENNSLFGEYFMDAKPQGSIRQRTVIKPTKPDQDFDVDLLVEFQPIEGWEPADYLHNLADEFRAMDRYEGKVDTRGKNRCVTIDYENDFHVDIVPTIKTVNGYVIMNKETNQFEQTDGDGYAAWFSQKGAVVGGDYLASVVRLLKYVRDSTGSFEIKSILLTTLVGHQVSGSDVRESHYKDLPTTFLTIVSRLDTFLQANPSMPRIDNPALPGENFNRRWDQAKYEKFRTQIHKYAAFAREAYDEVDINKSAEKWQKVFGEKFTAVEKSIGATKNTPIIPQQVGGIKIGDYSHRKTLKDININDPGSYPLPIKISAGLYFGRLGLPEINRRYQGKFSSGSELPIHYSLKYEVDIDPERYHQIYWQVVNTGPHARREEKLRGNIEPGEVVHWEPSLYTGVHWIECFVVDTRTNTCIGRSQPFFVVFKNSYYPYIESEWG